MALGHGRQAGPSHYDSVDEELLAALNSHAASLVEDLDSAEHQSAGTVDAHAMRTQRLSDAYDTLVARTHACMRAYRAEMTIHRIAPQLVCWRCCGTGGSSLEL